MGDLMLGSGQQVSLMRFGGCYGNALEILLDGYLPEEGTTVLCLILGVQQKDQHECCQDMAGLPFTAGSPGISATQWNPSMHAPNFAVEYLLRSTSKFQSKWLKL
jgi:hypothetical protein